LRADTARRRAHRRGHRSRRPGGGGAAVAPPAPLAAGASVVRHGAGARLMAISGPGRSHHQDDEEFAPSVFSEINITPLTDIFLVLLIIFMVGSSIVVEQAQGGGTGVRVELPKGAAKELHAAPRDFPVAVLTDGTVVTEGRAIDIGELRQKFAKLAKDSPDAQVII